MKNKTNKIKGLLIAVLALFAAGFSKAQCGFVDNQLGCSIQMQVLVYTPSGCASGIPCGGPITMNIPANSGPVAIPCNATCAAAGICEITVQLQTVNSTAVSPPIYCKTITTGPVGPTTIPAMCGGSAFLSYNTGTFTVN